MSNISPKRFYALEDQAYVMYLQLNAMTDLLVKHGIIEKNELVAFMDAMDGEISAITDEMEQMDKPAAHA